MVSNLRKNFCVLSGTRNLQCFVHGLHSTYFQPIQDALSNLPFAITTLECRENDNKITDCYGNNNVHEMCNIDTGAGVICE